MDKCVTYIDTLIKINSEIKTYIPVFVWLKIKRGVFAVNKTISLFVLQLI